VPAKKHKAFLCGLLIKTRRALHEKERQKWIRKGCSETQGGEIACECYPSNLWFNLTAEPRMIRTSAAARSRL